VIAKVMSVISSTSTHEENTMRLISCETCNQTHLIASLAGWWGVRQTRDADAQEILLAPINEYNISFYDKHLCDRASCFAKFLEAHRSATDWQRASDHAAHCPGCNPELAEDMQSKMREKVMRALGGNGNAIRLDLND
jgi:hypothetical protein